MADVIATLHKRNDPDTNIYPNVKDTNIPDTILRVADLGKYVNLLTSININGDADYVSVTSDIGTFTTADITTLNVSGTADIEGKATFGSDVEVDGSATFNSPESLVFKTGSLDFSELTSFIDTYYATGGIGRYQGHEFFSSSSEEYTSADTKWTDISYFLCNAVGYDFQWAIQGVSFTLADSIDFPSFTSPIQHAEFCIKGVKNDKVILHNFEHANIVDYYIFSFFDGKRIEVADGASVKMRSGCGDLFLMDTNLEYIGAIDMSEIATTLGMFSYCRSLKEIHCTHWKISFDISSSTQFEESDLVEIIGNLDTVTTAQTLTMGSTNLAKLTQDEILVATGRGWTLA